MKLAAFVFLVLLPAVLCFNHFTPSDNYLINCAAVSPIPALDSDNRLFFTDTNPSTTPYLILHAPKSHPLVYLDSNPNLSSSLLYHSARIFQAPSSYKFGINKPGTHIIRLHFRPNPDLDFQVSANEFLLIANGIPSTRNPYPNPVVKEFFIWVDSDSLEIRFTPKKGSDLSGYAYVSAIEVISAPIDLVADTALIMNSAGIGGRTSGIEEGFDGLMKRGLETVYRVNVGGPKVTPFNDSVWRTWVADDEFLKTDDVRVRRVYTTGQIKYLAGGASREVAPDFVYNTGRVIGGEKSVSVPDLNITWSFPVTEGCDYLVRLHFCDIASLALYMLHFNVYINGMVASENLDLSRITYGSLASPYYADFVVKGCELDKVINVSIGPSSLSRVGSTVAILNGVEIMKIANAMRSFDGEFGVDGTKGLGKGRMCDALPIVVIVCLLVILSMGIKSRLASIKDSGIWSQLSAGGSDSGMKYSNIPLSEKI